jgi:hypothetical protein
MLQWAEYVLSNRVVRMLLKYLLVIGVGAGWFLRHEEERALQAASGVEMTWVDAAYFATVLSTTVRVDAARIEF